MNHNRTTYDPRPSSDNGYPKHVSMQPGQPDVPYISPTEVRDALADEEVQGRRRRKRGWTIVFAVALCVFVVSVGALGVIGFSYFQGQQKYGEVATHADVGALADDTGDDTATSWDELEESIHVDWDALRAANPDTVAWIHVPNTVISYPVVQGEDNEHYLTYDFDGDAGWLANYGAIFMDYKNKPDWSDKSYFIYGHHMNDGSMFADLVGLEDPKRFDECRTVYLLSPKGNLRLRTFALVHCAPEEELVYTKFKDAKEMQDYIQDKMDRSIVQPPDAPSAKSIKKLFAFATCDNASWGRYVLYAYVKDASDDTLKGEIGIGESKDGGKEFVDEIEQKGERS